MLLALSLARAPDAAPALVPLTVAVSAQGPHAAAFDAERARAHVGAQHRVVDRASDEAAAADIVVAIDAGADLVVVEVRTRDGAILSRQDIAARDPERDALVWLVVRSALDRVAF